MSNRAYDEAAREARERVKAAGKRDLAELVRRFPVGTEVLVGEGRELKAAAIVKGHELNMVYKPLVVTTRGVYYGYEVERVPEVEHCAICAALGRTVAAVAPCNDCGAPACADHRDGYGCCDMCI